jgi:hypothetical protein
MRVHVFLEILFAELRDAIQLGPGRSQDGKLLTSKMSTSFDSV